MLSLLQATGWDMLSLDDRFIANIILFSGTASTLGFMLSGTGTLQCEKVSQYCLEYNDGSIHDVLPEEFMITAAAIVAIPAFWKACAMYREEQNFQNIGL